MPLWTNLNNEIPDKELPNISIQNIPNLNGAPGYLNVKHADTGSVLININLASIDLYEFSSEKTEFTRFQDILFMGAGKGTSKNSTLPLTSAYTLVDSTPTIRYKKNSGGATAPYYVRDSAYFLVGTEAAIVNLVSGTYIRVVNCSRTNATFINQYFVPFPVSSLSGFVSAAGTLNLVVIYGSTVYKLTVDPAEPAKMAITSLFNLGDGTSNDICALDDVEIMVFSPAKSDFISYDHKGNLLRESKAAVEASTYIFRKEPVGCSVVYKSSGKERLAMVYPVSNLNFTSPLFLPTDIPVIYSQRTKYTYNSIDGQIFTADPGSRISLIYLKQNVTKIPTVENTTDLIFQAASYSMQLSGSPNKQQFFLFPNMTQSDRFYVLTRETVISPQPPNIMRVYTKPLSLSCKNPNYLDKQNSKEYYYKVGTFSNPDGRREKQLMMIIRKDSLTISFEGAVKSPLTWLAAVFSAIAFGLAIFFMIKITLNLKKLTAVDNAKYVRRPDPASESLIMRNPNVPFSMASINKL